MHIRDNKDDSKHTLNRMIGDLSISGGGILFKSTVASRCG